MQGSPRREASAAEYLCSEAVGVEGKGEAEEHHLPVEGTRKGNQGVGTPELVGCTAAAMAEVVRARGLVATMVADCQYLAGARQEVTGRGSVVGGTKGLSGLPGVVLEVVMLMVLGCAGQGLRTEGQGRLMMASWVSQAEAAGRCDLGRKAMAEWEVLR